jgi:hypothetical protein
VKIFRSALDGWRKSVRRRMLAVNVIAAFVFLVSTPFENQRWFGLAVFAFAVLLFGLAALVALMSKTYASQWLEDEAPSDMKYRLLLTCVMSLGVGLALVLVAYDWWLDTL